MLKLILTDLDGTFLNDKGNFDHELYRKVRALMREKNIAFAPCTGKQCERVEKIFEPDGFEDLWILGDSATRIKHAGEYVYESLIPNDLGKEIILKLASIASDYTIIACTPTAAVVDDQVTEENMRFVRGSYQEVRVVADYQEIKEDFVKITVYDHKLRCFETVKELSEFEDQAYIVASEAAWIDISNKGVHKGTTVQQLQKILGVTKEETMAFGDGLNDLELLAEAEYNFAMRNAFDEIKEAAKYITGYNTDSAVLTTIEDFLLM